MASILAVLNYVIGCLHYTALAGQKAKLKKGTKIKRDPVLKRLLLIKCRPEWVDKTIVVKDFVDFCAQVCEMNILGWLKRPKNCKRQWKVTDYKVKWYPSNRSCVKHNMSNVSPQQMPPLMVRKAAWRR